MLAVRLITSAICVLVLSLRTYAQSDAILDQEGLFEKEIRPLLVEKCYKCHSGVKTNGGLSLENRAAWQAGGESGAVIVPGNAAASLLVQAVRYDGLEMPPKDAGGKLNDQQIASITRWVESGAYDPRDDEAHLAGMSLEDARAWWAFRPFADTKASEAEARDLTPISKSVDDYVNEELRKQNLPTTPSADRRTLIRRATYDLTGLPPTIDEVEQFVVDADPNAFSNLIERLLASPQYGVKWGRHWLDVVRYADTAGENTDRPLPHAWKYRNWVIDSFNKDLPFDEFVQLQIAGDLLRKDSALSNFQEGIIATGYLAIARRFGHDIDNDSHLMHEDVIDNLGKNFLGLSIGCARCHDHKYDPIPAEDYYALYGIFSSTRFAFPGCEAKGQPRDLVPLLPQSEVDALLQAWQQRNAAAEAEKQRRAELAVAFKSKAKALLPTPQLLVEAVVAEGATSDFPVAVDSPPLRAIMKQGEVLQLAVAPNGSHGADSTQVTWEISELVAESTSEKGAQQRVWTINEVVPPLLSGNPIPSHDGAAWCFLDVTDGPEFLVDRRDGIDGQTALQSWSSGDTPSVFANRSSAAVEVWTSLAANSFFMHPGINRKVAVAWICPEDMVVELSGRVTDVHPSGGGDGVSYQLMHLASANLGPALLQLGAASTSTDITIEPAPSIPLAYAVVEGNAKDARLHTRGDPEKLADSVPRRWLTAFGKLPIAEESGSGRLDLAKWIAPHPLTARVMVNRIWHWHFGRGLVATPNDFGSRGAPPSHPELLEMLTTYFRSSGYSVKAMHRLIMNSAAYQRDSSTPDAAMQDSDNRYLSRFVRRRLQAEELRDSLLTLSNRLDPTPAQAHPFPAEATWNFTQHNPFSAAYDTNKRSAYLMIARQRRDAYLSVFDGADPNASTAVRQTTTVPTQALYFLNDPQFHLYAAAFAERILSLPGSDIPVEEQIVSAFRFVFQRSPSTEESKRALGFLDTYPGSTVEKWSAFARILLASNEFLHVD
jgi:hypothetical protein